MLMVCIYLKTTSVHILASLTLEGPHRPQCPSFASPLGQGPVQARLPSHPLVHLVERLVSDCSCCRTLLMSSWNVDLEL